MAKSVSVTNRVFYPYENIMIVKRRYQYLEGYDAKRDQVKLPKSTKIGWIYIGTEKDDYIKIGKAGYWVLREIYIKNKPVYNLPK